MATSNYDVNVNLALATTALLEGDYASARDFLTDAQRLATDRVSRAHVLLQGAKLRMRQLPAFSRLALAY